MTLAARVCVVALALSLVLVLVLQLPHSHPHPIEPKVIEPKVLATSVGLRANLNIPKTKDVGEPHNDTVHIAMVSLGSERRYIEATTSIRSLLMARTTPLVVHLLTDEVGKKYVSRFFAGVDGPHSCFELRFLHAPSLIGSIVRPFLNHYNLSVTHYAGEAAMLKLFMHEIFPTMSHLVVLDTDTITMRNIGELWDLLHEMHHQPSYLQTFVRRDAFVPTDNKVYVKSSPQPQDYQGPAIGIWKSPNYESSDGVHPPTNENFGPYFVGGVYLLRLQEMRRINFTKLVRESVEYWQGRFPDFQPSGSDQSFYNMVLVRHMWLGWELPCAWNMHRNMYYEAYFSAFGPHPCLAHKPGILHFATQSNRRDGGFFPDLWFAFQNFPPTFLANCPVKNWPHPATTFHNLLKAQLPQFR